MELAREVVIANRTRSDECDRDKRLAWMVGMLSQPLKKYPSYASWMGPDEHSTARDPRQVALMRARVYAAQALVGGTITTRAQREAAMRGES